MELSFARDKLKSCPQITSKSLFSHLLLRLFTEKIGFRQPLLKFYVKRRLLNIYTDKIHCKYARYIYCLFPCHAIKSEETKEHEQSAPTIKLFRYILIPIKIENTAFYLACPNLVQTSYIWWRLTFARAHHYISEGQVQ